jgi:hypothetical protein
MTNITPLFHNQLGNRFNNITRIVNHINNYEVEELRSEYREQGRMLETNMYERVRDKIHADEKYY